MNAETFHEQRLISDLVENLKNEGITSVEQKISYPEQYDYNERNYYLKVEGNAKNTILILCDIESNKENLDSLASLLELIRANYIDSKSHTQIAIETVLLARMGEGQGQFGLRKFIAEFYREKYGQIFWIRNLGPRASTIFYPGTSGFDDDFSTFLQDIKINNIVISNDATNISKELDGFDRSVLVVDRSAINLEILSKFEHRPIQSNEFGYKSLIIDKKIIFSEPEVPIVILVLLSLTTLISVLIRRRFNSIFLVLKKNLFHFLFYYLILLASTILSHLMVKFILSSNTSDLPVFETILISVVISNVFFSLFYSTFAHRLVPHVPIAYQSMLLPASVSLFVWSLFSDISLSLWFFPLLLVCFPQKNPYQRRFYIIRFLAYLVLVGLLIAFGQEKLAKYLAFSNNNFVSFVFVIFCFNIVPLNLIMAGLSIRKNSGKRLSRLSVAIISSLLLLALFFIGIFSSKTGELSIEPLELTRRQDALLVGGVSPGSPKPVFSHPLGLYIPLSNDTEIPDIKREIKTEITRIRFQKYDQIKIIFRGLSPYLRSQLNFSADEAHPVLGSNFLFVEDSSTTSHIELAGYVSPELTMLLQVKPRAKIFMSLDTTEKLLGPPNSTIQSNLYLGILP